MCHERHACMRSTVQNNEALELFFFRKTDAFESHAHLPADLQMLYCPPDLPSGTNLRTSLWQASSSSYTHTHTPHGGRKCFSIHLWLLVRFWSLLFHLSFQAAYFLGFNLEYEMKRPLQNLSLSGVQFLCHWILLHPSIHLMALPL